MSIDVQANQAIAAIRSLAWSASSLVMEDLEYWLSHREMPEYRNTHRVERAIETAFLQLLTLADSLGQVHLSEIIRTTYSDAKRIGLGKFDQFEGETAWSSWSGPLLQLADAIEAVYGAKQPTMDVVSTDLLTLLQNMQGAITDKRCFSPPKNEKEVHDRIEVFLRCLYPDLIRKPPLAKPVVSFIPDSGIPSIRTLIEYKFMSNQTQAGVIANEILADTRGYAESGWMQMVFVIYETKRFKTPYEWRQLLFSCGLKENIQLIVLHGEEPSQKVHSSNANDASNTTATTTLASTNDTQLVKDEDSKESYD